MNKKNPNGQYLTIIALATKEIAKHTNSIDGHTRELKEAMISHDTMTREKLNNIKELIYKVILVLLAIVGAIAGIKVMGG